MFFLLHSKLETVIGTSSEETLLCLPALPVKQNLALHILLFTAQLSAVQWNIGVTVFTLMYYSKPRACGGDACLLDIGGEQALLDGEEVRRSDGESNEKHLGWTKTQT